MNRHYYIADNLAVLANLQGQLRTRGVDDMRMHVLTEQDSQAGKYEFNEVDSLSKTDIIRFGLRGTAIGILLAALVLLSAYWLNLMDTVWALPFTMLAAVVLSFCIWEGGLIGAQRYNQEMSRFKEELDHERHVFLVDLEQSEEGSVGEALADYPGVRPAGTGKAPSGFVWKLRKMLHTAIHSMP